MHSKEFNYKSGTDRNPSVLVTAENQHTLRGFNTNYMTKGQATRIQNEWNRVKNQPWSLTAKERVLMKRVGKPAQSSFRMYRKDYIG
tara:strand:+ start:158 stop:418 length:261 start_codon:yes stop_codon:yes gene_type:complete